MCIRFPPGPLCQALLPLKLLSISTPLYLSQSLHPTVPCKPGAADTVHPGSRRRASEGSRLGKQEGQDNPFPLQSYPCPQPHTPSPKFFTILLL